MTPVLLVDVMDTLVYNPFNEEIPQFFGINQAELIAQKDPAAWVRFETGEINEAEYLRTCFADGRSFDHHEFLRVVQNAYRWVEGAEVLLERLTQQGFELHAFSNYPVWYRAIEDRLRLSRYISWTFVSCLTGVRKPDSAAYFGAAQKLNMSVKDCLLIDDSVANCTAAESTGMPAIQFLNTVELWSELKQRGLIR